MATSQPETDDVTVEAVDEPDTGASGSKAAESEASETTAKITTAKASRPAPKAAKARDSAAKRTPRVTASSIGRP